MKEKIIANVTFIDPLKEERETVKCTASLQELPDNRMLLSLLSDGQVFITVEFAKE